MRIAMIGHKRIPGREGGVEVVVEELATRMSNLGYDIVVYNRASKKLSINEEYEGVKLVTIPTIQRKSLNAVVYSFFASIHALFGKYDIVHFHALGPSVMLIIPHIFGLKTVVTVHGLNWKTPKWAGVGATYIKLGEIITAKFADEIIVLSLEQQKYFKEKYNRTTNYIPNGVSLPVIRELDIVKNKWNLSKNEYILFLSRIVPGKGLEYLIQAYAKVVTDKKLVIAGEGEFVSDFVESMRALAENDSRILFTGFVEGKVLDELYSNTYLYVFPSEAEGMSLCLLEALSYNCNCLISNIPENLEVIGTYGTKFKSKDIDNLALKLQQSINEPNVVSNSREYIKQKYDWNDVVKKTIAIYDKK